MTHLEKALANIVALLEQRGLAVDEQLKADINVQLEKVAIIEYRQGNKAGIVWFRRTLSRPKS